MDKSSWYSRRITSSFQKLRKRFLASGTNTGTRQYIGEEIDSESGLNYLNARYYDNQRGQFNAQDPVFWEIGKNNESNKILVNPQQLNSYSYASNNPIVKSDPSGKCPQCLIGATAFTVGYFAQYGSDIYQNYQDGKRGLDTFPNLNQLKNSGVRGLQSAGTAVVATIAPQTIIGVLATGGTAASLSLAGDYTLGENLNFENAAINGVTSGVATGILNQLPQISGRLPNFGTKAFFFGAHAANEYRNEILSLSIEQSIQKLYEATKALSISLQELKTQTNK